MEWMGVTQADLVWKQDHGPRVDIKFPKEGS